MGYAGRNVVNAPAVRQALLARSAARRDHPEIAAWLGNHFHRWIIGTFAHVLPVRDVRDWSRCMGKAVAPPAWVQAHFLAPPQTVAPLCYIDPAHHLLLEQERSLLEFLNVQVNARLAGKLHKITCFEAQRRWQADHERMARQRRRGWAPSSEGAYRAVWATAQGRFIELASTGLLLRSELAYESFHMQHCLGDFDDMAELQGGYGAQHAHRIEEGELRVLSWRDLANKPHVTISLQAEGDGWVIEQIKGKQNRVPAQKYHGAIREVLQHLQCPVGDAVDALRMGLMDEPQASPPRLFFYHERPEAPQAAWMLAGNPTLIRQHPRPGLREQWLAATQPLAVLALDQPHPHVRLAAMHSLAAADLDAQDRVQVGEAAWLRAALDGSASPGPLMQVPPAPSPVLTKPQVPAAAWWRRMLDGWRETVRPVSPEEWRLRWVFATMDLLCVRQSVAHWRNTTFSLGMSPEKAQRLLKVVGREIGLESPSAPDQPMRVAEFCARFFGAEELTPGWSRRAQPLQASPWDLLAFAGMRNAFVLRVLTAHGLVPEPQALRLLALHAQRVADCHSSWDDFAQSYARGRTAWLAHTGSREQPSVVRHEIAAYLEGSNCNWRELPWHAFAMLNETDAQRLHADWVTQFRHAGSE